jgi:fibronectin type 3 domain-containing protein
MASAGTNHSGMSNVASTATPLNAPTGLVANSSTGTSVVLNWTDADTSALGYTILRSTDNTTFTKIASVSGVSAHTFTDATVSTAHAYYYQVQALNAYATSAVSSTATVSTPLLAPTNLAASAVGNNINLTWTDKDASATGFVVLRSTDGVNFSQLTTLTGTTVQSYADTTATAGTKYYYQVQATATGFTSASSNTVNFTIAAPPPSTTTVSVATEYSNELVVTSTGKDDSISISQSGSTLSIVADGTTTTDPVPAAGLFVYTRGGADSISIASSVTAPTTLETIDAAVDDITSAGTNVTVWDDSTDIFTGTGTVHSVSAFAGGVSKSSGASLANPKDIGSSTTKLTGSLFGTGPIAADINQGEVGDCYFLSSLAAFANTNASVLTQSAVDMNDGTYVVQFMNGTTPTYVRVNSVVSASGGSPLYARPGSDGDIWAPIMEKAYAYFRTGANTYASLNSGWMGDVYAAFGVGSQAFFPSQMTSSAFYTMVSTDLAAGEAVTLGTGGSAPQLVSDHSYTLISASMVNGVATYVVRNPWGVQGDSLENSQGYATLTFTQLENNFVDGAEAT